VSAVTAPLKRTRVPVPERPRHLRVVEEPRERHTLRYALLIIAVLGLGIFGTVGLNAMAAANSVESRELQTRVAEAERSYAELVAEVAALESPARIRDAASGMGMVQASGGRHVQLERPLPADGASDESVPLGGTTDPLKPVLSVER
jgi:hypothetical protein